MVNWNGFLNYFSSKICLADVDAIAGLRGERFIKNNEEHLRVKDLFVEFNIGGATVQLDDLFNGDIELGMFMAIFVLAIHCVVLAIHMNILAFHFIVLAFHLNL